MRHLVVAVLLLWQVAATASAQSSADSTTLAESYTLADAIAEARANSLRLERARAEVDRAAASLDAAEAELNPSISFSGSASLLGNPPEGVAIEPGDLGTVTEPGSTFPLPVPEQRIVLVPDADSQARVVGRLLASPRAYPRTRIEVVSTYLARVSGEEAPASAAESAGR